MIYIIHKILVLLKNHLDFLKVVFSNAFLRSIILIFFKNIITESLSLKEENIIKNIRNLFRLKKRTKLHCN